MKQPLLLRLWMELSPSSCFYSNRNSEVPKARRIYWWCCFHCFANALNTEFVKALNTKRYHYFIILELVFKYFYSAKLEEPPLQSYLTEYCLKLEMDSHSCSCAQLSLIILDPCYHSNESEVLLFHHNWISFAILI